MSFFLRITLIVTVLESFAGFAQNWDWATKISANGSEYVWDIAHDSQDNLIVTGRYKGNVTFHGTGSYTVSYTPFGPETDAFLAKYDKNGVLLWAHQMGGVSADWGRSVTVDANDNIYVTGDFVNEAYFGDDTIFGYDNGQTAVAAQARSGFLAKYQPDGTLVWADKFQGGDRCRGYGITVDSNGNLYLTGVMENLTSFDGITIGEVNALVYGFIAKYDTDGNCTWAHYFDSPYGSQGNDVQLLDDESILCTGFYKYQLQYDGQTITGVSPTWGDYFMMRIDSAGNFVWNVKGTGPYYIEGFNVAVTDNKDIFVTGHFAGTMNLGDTSLVSMGIGGSTSLINAHSNGFVARYDELGNRLWVRQLGGKLRIEPDGIAVSQDGKMVCVAGYMEDTLYESSTQDTILPTPGYETGFVIGYDEYGVKQWHKIIQAGGAPIAASYNSIQGNAAYCITLDNSDNIMVAGLFGDLAYWDATYQDAYTNTTDGFVAKMFPPLQPVLDSLGANCVGDTIFFASGAYGDPLTYTWSSSNNSIVYQDQNTMQLHGVSTQSDTVMFIVSNGYVSDTAIMYVDFAALPAVDLGTDYSTCAFQDTLNAGDGAVLYDWDGAGSVLNDSLLIISASGSYIVMVTNSSGCFASDSITVTFDSGPSTSLGADYSTCDLTDTLLASSSIADLLYDWGSGPLVNDSLLIINTSGSYHVLVTDAFGCSSADTITVTLDACAGLNPGQNQAEFIVYPNPVKEVLYVGNYISENLNYQVADMTGRIVLNGQLNGVGEIDVTSLKPGQYLLILRSSEMMSGQYKITKQ